MTRQTLYRKLRAQGMGASHALHAARTQAAFDALEEDGIVRLRWIQDNAGFDDSYLECQGMKPGHVESARKALWAQIERDGVWGLVSEVFDGEEWQQVDSCWGFVGQNASWYEFDIMASAVDAAEKLSCCVACKRPNVIR